MQLSATRYGPSEQCNMNHGSAPWRSGKGRRASKAAIGLRSAEEERAGEKVSRIDAPACFKKVFRGCEEDAVAAPPPGQEEPHQPPPVPQRAGVGGRWVGRARMCIMRIAIAQSKTENDHEYHIALCGISFRTTFYNAVRRLRSLTGE
jgi:hypothetical protein